MKHYYVTHGALTEVDKIGCFIISLYGEFDLAEAHKEAKIRTGFIVPILFWHEVSEYQKEKFTDFCNKEQPEYQKNKLATVLEIKLPTNQMKE